MWSWSVCVMPSAGIVKAGFLFKQSSGVRKDWKLRWFFVRSGKLY